jgi:hypothetical protein
MGWDGIGWRDNLGSLDWKESGRSTRRRQVKEGGRHDGTELQKDSGVDEPRKKKKGKKKKGNNPSEALSIIIIRPDFGPYDRGKQASRRDSQPN